MDDDIRYTIGELARRTGLPVRTIRFYSDAGVVPPTGRTPAGYRLYDLDALVRLDLVRTLRDLGVDLATIQRLLAREVGLADVASAHAEALDVQIRTLRLRRAVLRAVAKRGSSQKEMELMHKLAKLSDEERRRIIEEFVDATFEGLDVNPEFVAMMRSAAPELPDDPTPEQVEAWVELAELVRDDDFRASVRRMAEHQAAERADRAATDRAATGGTQADERSDGAATDGAAGGSAAPGSAATGGARAAERADGVQAGGGADRQLAELTRERAGAAREAGVEPGSERARAVVDGLVAEYARLVNRTDDAEFRRWLHERLATGTDARAERYWQLMATINGWPRQPSLVPAFEWFIKALENSAPAGRRSRR